MLAGQRLNSTRLKSQELPEFEPSEELAEDNEPPQGRRTAAAARLPDMPAQRAGSTASRAYSTDLMQRKMSGQLSSKSARRSAFAHCLAFNHLCWTGSACRVNFKCRNCDFPESGIACL